MHSAGCFLMPNPWDRGSARYLKHLGFRALATTSAGFAFSLGLSDSVRALECDAVVEHVRDLVDATGLPIHVDFQHGYGRDADEVAANIASCVRAGAAGLSIEDASGEQASPLFARSHAIERVAAARRAIDAIDPDVILTARCEAWLLSDPDARRLTLERLVAFAEAGADCLAAPGIRDPAVIAEVVAAVAPMPVNVVMAAPISDVNLGRLAELGVRRVSVGSALARVAWAAFARAAAGLQEGSFELLGSAMPFAELNRLFTSPS